MAFRFRSARPPEGLARYRPALTQPLSLDDALRALKTICVASRQPTGGRPHATCISESAEHGLVSTVRSAVTHAAVDAADVRMVLPDLPQHAAAAARARGNSSPSEAASRARRALRLLTGIDAEAKKIDAPHLFISDGFVRLQSFADRRQDRSKLVVLARTCAAMGAYQAPAQMPDVQSLLAFANQQSSPYRPNSVRNAVSAYRRVRARAIQVSTENTSAFEALPIPPAANSRMARALHHRPEIGEGHSGARGARLLRLAHLLRPQLPQVAEELARYVERMGGKPWTQAWETAMVNAVRRMLSLVEEVYTSGECDGSLPDRSELRLWHLYAISVPKFGVETTARGDQFYAGVGRLRGEFAPLMHRLITMDAPRARRESSLGTTGAHEGDWMPEVCIRNECAIWSLIVTVYREALALDDWEAQEVRRTRIMRSMHEMKAGADVRSGRELDKTWLATHISLPLLVCVGLPWLARAAREARAAWMRVMTAEAGADVCTQAYRAYAFALHDYCAMAVSTDDGMRRKNYTNARLGRQIHVAYRDGRLATVRLTFGTDRHDPACLKITERRGRKRKRGAVVQPHVHSLSPSGVDFELLDLWLREVAPGFSYQAPEWVTMRAPSADALAGQYLFPSSPRSQSVLRAGGEFAARVHDTLFAVIRLLHGDAVPAKRKDLPLAQRKACTLHRIRLLVTNYWGGVRNDWKYAEHLTSDLRKTLEDFYHANMSTAMQDLLQQSRDDWRHPQFFDDLMDAIRASQPVALEADARVRALLDQRAVAMAEREPQRAPRRWRARRRRTA